MTIPGTRPEPTATPHRLSRRRLLQVALGATAGVVALDRVVAALPAVDGAAGALQNGELQTAERIIPTTTLPPVAPPPPGQIMFPILAPTSCWISDNFGDCRGSNCSRRHEGLDSMGTEGDQLVAVVTGRLVKKYVDTGLTYGAGNGWTLYDETTDITYKYFHMGSHAAGLAEGDTVQQGTVIGTLGNTGTSGANSSTNYHLHFEYRPANQPQDPRPLLVRPPECTFYG